MRPSNPHLEQLRQQRAVLMPQIDRLAKAGCTCRQISEKLGLSKTTVAEWLRKPSTEPLGPDE